jgi:hypothetical protein
MAATLTEAGLDIVWVMVTTVDEVFDPPRQVKLAVDVDAEIAGSQPATVVRSVLGVATELEPTTRPLPPFDVTLS